MTVLEVSLPHKADLALDIYDMSGRLVRHVVAGQMPAGEHRFRWEGDDRSGRQVATGVYYVRLRADQNTVVEKLVLMR